MQRRQGRSRSVWWRKGAVSVQSRAVYRSSEGARARAEAERGWRSEGGLVRLPTTRSEPIRCPRSNVLSSSLPEGIRIYTQEKTSFTKYERFDLHLGVVAVSSSFASAFPSNSVDATVSTFARTHADRHSGRTRNHFSSVVSYDESILRDPTASASRPVQA